MRDLYYILKGTQVVPVDDPITWGIFFEENDRRVAYNDIVCDDRVLNVSTVFIGLDHNFTGEGPPILFETMVFQEGHPQDLVCKRCSTFAEAEQQHEEIVDEMKEKYSGIVMGREEAENA